MKTAVIYDSFFGNTEKVAEEIVKCLKKERHNVELHNVEDIDTKKIKHYELLIVGSPTRGFRPSEKIMEFLENIPTGNSKFIAFDTRIDEKDIESKVLKFFAKFFKYADQYISLKLKKKGYTEIVPSKGFYVKDKEGPLKNRELEKAQEWLNLLQ